MRKRILALSFFPAFVPPTSGGESRLYSFYYSLSRHFDVTLLTSTHINVEPEVVNHGLNFVEYRIPKDNYFVEQYSRLSEYSSGGDLSGPSIAACSNYPTKLHQAFLDHYNNADIIVYDFPFVSGCDVFAGLDSKPRVYNSHNCESLLYKQLHPENKSFPIHDLVRDAEIKLLSTVDLVLYCAEADKYAFRDLYPSGSYLDAPAPHGLNPRALITGRKFKTSENFIAIFMGSSHIPNVLAAEYIVKVLAPLFPEIRFEILGGCLKEGFYPSNVVRLGIVSDIDKSALLLNANLALNPMHMGSGSNVKILDFVAHGLPVLSTPFGMRGSDLQGASDYIVAELEQFPDKLRDFLNGNIKLSKLPLNHSSMGIEGLTWDAVADSVTEALTRVVLKKKETIAPSYVLALNDYDSFATLSGGGVRTRCLYESLGEDSPVVFICFSHDGLFWARKYSELITVIAVPITSKHKAEREELDRLHHISVADIVASRNTLENPTLLKVYEVLREFARCIVIEHCYMVPLPRVYGDRFVYSSQNNETKLKEHWLAWHPLSSTLIDEVEQLERFAVENASLIIAVSDEDAQSLVAGRHAAPPVIVVPNGALTPVYLSPDETHVLSGILMGEQTVAFLGSAHMPNIEAAEYIVHNIAPQCPDVQFHLIGTATCSISKVPSNVRIWGQVDEELKSAILQSCSLAINPMSSGSGSNVKVSDYIGNGLFVVSTQFGMRGYPASAKEHAKFVDLDSFAEVIVDTLKHPTLYSNAAKIERRRLFEKELSMVVLASKFSKILKEFYTKRKRVLCVTYRYTIPLLGGAEVHFEKFVRALGESGLFDVDVVAPRLSGITNRWRFSEEYSCAPDIEAPVNIPNVCFKRYPLDEPNAANLEKVLVRAWQSQPVFERYVSQQLIGSYTESGLLWGWGYPEFNDKQFSRWGFVNAGIFLAKEGAIKLIGDAPIEAVITISQSKRIVAGPFVVKGRFEVDFCASTGEIEITTSVSRFPEDPRPLAFRLLNLKILDKAIDIAAQSLPDRMIKKLPHNEIFHLLDKACEESRSEMGVELTEARGPWSSALEQYIENNISAYDLVVTHNNIFRPAVFALTAAKNNAVPSILIPHAHLDDDFYHFPDVKQSARDASLVLAVPKAACQFMSQIGCNVSYLPAGCDTQEIFLKSDIEAFRDTYVLNKPFVLVLGRKAGAKGYESIMLAIDDLCARGVDIHVVLIGPDDDGRTILSPNASYLGQQSREVVRGALQSCIALCNMSVSESFGIVLLEAWLAGKPVIANKDCVAFHDMAVHEHNALLVSEKDVAEAVQRLINNPVLRAELASNGKLVADQFDWNSVSQKFVKTCIETAR